MEFFKIVPTVKLIDDKAVFICEDYCNNGADELFIFDSSYDDISHDKNLDILKQISGKVDVPFMAYGNIKRLEDVKKYIYAGASRAVLDMSLESNIALVKEASERFGKEKIALYFNEKSDIEIMKTVNVEYVDLIIADNNFEAIKELAKQTKVLFFDVADKFNYGMVIEIKNNAATEILDIKTTLNSKEIKTFTLKSSMEFKEFTTLPFDERKLITVVVQDYRTDEVLMVAYMNQEAYDITIQTGRMTYFSRSRNEIWVKGLTSGHFQYLKELRCDCDKDTLLAKVFQVGAACHTGNNSCFFETIAKKEYRVNNPAQLLNDVYDVIMDRKVNPKEGSYTNYLFDKGIDKILKKLGEEATEIVIAAKNPNPEEIKYEISDFLYHMLVLMAEKGVTWQEVLDELSRRG